eukprot:gene7212-6808_t
MPLELAACQIALRCLAVAAMRRLTAQPLNVYWGPESDSPRPSSAESVTSADDDGQLSPDSPPPSPPADAVTGGLDGVLPRKARENVPFQVRLFAYEDLPRLSFLRMSTDPQCLQGTDFPVSHSAPGMHSSVAYDVKLPQGLYYTCLGDSSAQSGTTLYPVREMEDGCLRPVSVEPDSAAAGTALSAAALALGAVGGLLAGRPAAALHALRTVRATMCSSVSVSSGFEDGLSALMEPLGDIFPVEPHIANVIALFILLILVSLSHMALVFAWKNFKGTHFTATAMLLWFPFIPWLVMDLTWDSVLYSSLQLFTAEHENK